MVSSNKNETKLKFYKLHENAKDPIYATEGSACFDIHACFDGLEKNRANIFMNVQNFVDIYGGNRDN